MLLFCGPGMPLDHSVLSAPGVGGFDTADIGGGGTVITGKLPVLPAPAGADCANALALAKVKGQRQRAGQREIRFHVVSPIGRGAGASPVGARPKKA